MFFNWIVCLPGVESCEFYIFFGDQTLVQGMIGNFIFPYVWFPFHFADVFFSLSEALDEESFKHSSLVLSMTDVSFLTDFPALLRYNLI